VNDVGPCLKAVSRYDHLYSLAAGYNDASLFEGAKEAGAYTRPRQSST
jgi:hypothetical protein